MKPAVFEYSRPADLDEACAMLAAGGDDVRLIAGGQTLLPLMRLIDIARIGAARAGGEPPVDQDRATRRPHRQHARRGA
jgi:hypothetical protein